jgi:DNA polymerase-3 subunit epsilon
MIRSLLFIDAEFSEKQVSLVATDHQDSSTEFSIVQLAWILFDIRGNEITRGDYLIKPYDGQIIKYNPLHKIDMQSIIQHGYYDSYVFKVLYQLILDYQPAIIAHNLHSTQKLISNHLQKLSYVFNWSNYKTVCTRDLSAKIFGLPPGEYYNLPELYEKLFNIELLHANNAMVDAEATAECFFKLLNKFSTPEAIQIIDSQHKGSNSQIPLIDAYFNGNVHLRQVVIPQKEVPKASSNPIPSVSSQKSKVSFLNLVFLIIGIITILANPDNASILLVGFIVLLFGLIPILSKL